MSPLRPCALIPTLDNPDTVAEVVRAARAHLPVIVIDDGSEDQTEEIGLELAKEFPQVRVIRHHHPSGIDASIRTGMLHSRGNLVFIDDQAEVPEQQELKDFWALGGSKHLVVGSSAAAPLYLNADLISRLQTWGMLVSQNTSSNFGNQSHRSPSKIATGTGCSATLPTSSSERR